jgi:hypothetical protein
MGKINGRCLVLVWALWGVLMFATMASAAVTTVRCVVWQGDPLKYHTAISGSATTQLKGVVNTDSTAAIYYKWVFGDGTSSTIGSTSGSTKYNLDVKHTYTAAVGTPFTAELQVSNENTVSVGVKSSQYLVQIQNGTDPDVKINITIDNGLWWLYRNGGAFDGHTYDNSAFMAWQQSGSSWATGALVSPTAAAIHAFAINGHKVKNDKNKDPYAEAVQLGMNFLVKGYKDGAGSPELHAVTLDLAHSPQGIPNGSVDTYGIENYDSSVDIPYQSGAVMDGIMASGVDPADYTGRDFTQTSSNIVVKNWTYGELIQDMADMIAWGQNDSNCSGTSEVCGSWWYGWNYGSNGDNSASQWPAIGLIPAQQPPWNVSVPSWVKTYNTNWLKYSMGCSGPSSKVTSCTYNTFGYNGPDSGYQGLFQTTPSGMVQMILDGQQTTDLKWGKGKTHMADGWRSFLHDGLNYGPYSMYGWYSFAKAMRLSLLTATTQITKTSGATFDWYYGNPNNAACTTEANCEKGLALRIVETQSIANNDTFGQWPAQLGGYVLDTAWMIITLKPALFAAAPIACYDYNPKSTYSNATITFDPTCSGHSNPLKSLTKFEWDWDNNGTYETTTTTPAVQTNSFTCSVPPCTFPVTLRVTDNSTPALTATVIKTVNITNPPHAPVADAGGPYVVSLCAGDSLTLDGSKSFDPDDGQHEAGCTTCPNDTITKYGWDLVEPLTNFDNKFGKTVTLTPAEVQLYFPTGGIKNIGLQVTDNTRLAFPTSGQPNLTGEKFSTTQVYVIGLCSLTARAKKSQVQLSWTIAGSATYDIERSTAGPNTGFVKIASGYATTYGVYLDTTVTNGVTYWYRIVDTSTGKWSNVAKAKPVSLF